MGESGAPPPSSKMMSMDCSHEMYTVSMSVSVPMVENRSSSFMISPGLMIRGCMLLCRLLPEVAGADVMVEHVEWEAPSISRQIIVCRSGMNLPPNKFLSKNNKLSVARQAIFRGVGHQHRIFAPLHMTKGVDSQTNVW